METIGVDEWIKQVHHLTRHTWNITSHTTLETSPHIPHLKHYLTHHNRSSRHSLATTNAREADPLAFPWDEDIVANLTFFPHRSLAWLIEDLRRVCGSVYQKPDNSIDGSEIMLVWRAVLSKSQKKRGNLARWIQHSYRNLFLENMIGYT